MATPNEPDPQKKPAVPPNKPGATPPQGAKPAPSKITNKVPPKTPEKTPPEKAPASKGITPTKKPAPAKKEAKSDGGRRKLGQILVDLGFIDDDQLWEIFEEAKNQAMRIG